MLMYTSIGECAKFTSFAEENSAIKFEKSDVELNYENFNYQEILKEILPAEVEIPGGYESIGDIAHMNLHEN